MKNKIKYVTCFLFIVSFIIGCRKKYEEDPFTMRFVNLGKRIEGEWSIHKILIDGADSTSIIYVDSLKFFSTYIFGNYSHKYSQGSLKVKTHNGLFSYDDISFNFVNSDKLNSMVLCLGYTFSREYLENNKILIPYGPINTFDCSKHYLKIHMLTRTEMHLSVSDNAKTYELIFKKISE